MPTSTDLSVAGFGRRVLAVSIDWFIALGLSALAVGIDPALARYQPAAVELSWIVLGVIGVRFFGFTSGQLALGLKVVSVDRRRHVGIGRAAVRALLVALVIPPLFADSDGRGIQDRLTNTAVVRR
ncbi:MAG: RDD family protein [Mycobacteriaceae bacterium]|nr:RDD family protein [Mycobacteriaceae bacterium]